MTFDTTSLVSFALLFFRVIIAVIIYSSGKSHLMHPIKRGKTIGMPPTITKILGVAEISGAISIAFGIFTQIGAVILIIVMIGAIYKKVFVWKTKFYEEKGYGWHYDLLLLLGLFVIFASDGGHFTVI